MTADQDARRNYAVLLGQGISFDAATDLTSVKLVLPFLYTTAGAPVLFAGMLVPVWTVAKRLVQVFVAPLVGAARSNKTLMALASLVSALAIVLISLTFNTAGVYWLVPIFLSVALIIGAANGVGSLGFQDLVGRVLSPERRRKLLFTQSSIAAMIVVIIAFGSQAILKPGTSLAAHQELIWLGIGLFLLSALTIMMIREPAKSQPGERASRDKRGEIAVLKDSFQVAFALPWFGRFLIARTLYLSIELAIPFFSVHAASFHGNSISGLSAFIIAANIGLIVGLRLGKTRRALRPLDSDSGGRPNVHRRRAGDRHRIEAHVAEHSVLRDCFRACQSGRTRGQERPDALSSRNGKRQGATLLHCGRQSHDRHGVHGLWGAAWRVGQPQGCWLADFRADGAERPGRDLHAQATPSARETGMT